MPEVYVIILFVLFIGIGGFCISKSIDHAAQNATRKPPVA